MLISLCILSLNVVLPVDFFFKSPLWKTLTATVRLLRVESSVYSKPFLFPGSRVCVPGGYLVTSEAVGSRDVGKWLVYSPGVSCHSSLVALDSLRRVKATDLIASHSGATLRQLSIIRLHVLVILLPLSGPSHCNKDISTIFQWSWVVLPEQVALDPVWP